MTAKHWNLSILFCFSALMVSSKVAADNQVTQIPFADSSPGTVGLGLGIRNGASPYRYVDSISSLENDNVRDMMPLYLYEGKYLFFHGTRAGIHLWDEGVSIDAVAQYRFYLRLRKTSQRYLKF